MRSASSPFSTLLVLVLAGLLSERPALAVKSCDGFSDDEEGTSSQKAVSGTTDASADCQDSSLVVVNTDDPSELDGEECSTIQEMYTSGLCSSKGYSDTYYTYYRDRDGDEYYDSGGGQCCAVAVVLVPSYLTGPSNNDGLITGFVYSEVTSGKDCDDTDAALTEIVAFYPDSDGDGYPSKTGSVDGCKEDTKAGYVQARSDSKWDCDDDDANANPGENEVCDDDDIDEDCDGKADNDDSSASNSGKTVFYPDADKDGFGDKSSSGSKYCDDPSSASGRYSQDHTDCDDDNSATNPDATEICDGEDNDCDPSTDEDEVAGETWYYDDDGDGYGVSAATKVSCSDPDTSTTSDWVDNDDDCDDDNSTVYPSATEACDGVYNDCYERGGGSSAPGDEVDNDGDHYVECEYDATIWVGSSSVNGGDDCDDSDDSVFPEAREICDGQYNDCSSRFYSATSAPDDERDLDSDGYVECDGYYAADWVGSASVIGGEDCAPSNGNAYPGASEICDGAYDDCSDPDWTSRGAPEEELDGDGDGYVPFVGCDMADWAGDSAVVGGDDCDDDDLTIHPDALELCDGQYNDCYDPAFSTTSAPAEERDLDNDNYVACEYVEDIWTGDPTIVGGDDCDDRDLAVFPAAEELCDGQFNDCNDHRYDPDGAPDDESDLDADTYVACDGYDPTYWEGADTVTADGDCDDADGTVFPSATEICDGQYNDCLDPDYDPAGAPSGEMDSDGDGYVRDFCEPSEVEWHGDPLSVGGNDCDDVDPLVYPGADEICDGQYNDCEDPDYEAGGEPVDERDRDRDGFVVCRFVEDLWAGDPSVTGGQDCEDLDATVFPGATEVCDGQYNDCDDRSYSATSAPDDETDADSDSYVICADFSLDTWLGDPAVLGGDDCNDEDPTVYPAAEEICDGQYNDCDDRYYDAETPPEEELDADEDGYVPCDVDSRIDWAGSTTPDGGGDCDDSSDTVFPGAPERCNGRYDDCDDPAYIFGLQDAPDDELDDDDDDYVECNYAAAAWVGDDVTVVGGDDCDDTDATTYPSASELCDGQYNDCDDAAYTDDDSPADEWDDDGDGFVECVRYASVDWRPFDGVTDAPENDWLEGCINNRECTDCDDDDAYAHPGAAEQEDELECMVDHDDDGFGDESAADPVTAGTDCDDEDSAAFPYAVEVCEADEQVDNDCNGDVNTWYDPELGEDVPVDAADGLTVYLDADGDGFGDPDLPYEICAIGEGFSLQPTDCDDSDANRYPGATELCNDADDDCDAEVDESADLDPAVSGCVDMFRDNDRDSYGDYDVVACLCRLDGETSIEDRGDTYVISGGDCDDTDDEIHPLSCRDGIDNDGDGAIDGLPGEADGDSDCLEGYDELGTTIEVRVETMDGSDNDCDGFVSLAELDCDDDGAFASLPTVTTVGEDAAQFGLSSCVSDPDARMDLSCWGETLGVECDDESGLWMFRYDESDDGWGGRYVGGRRVWTTSSGCDTQGDCDDQCASRCPGAEEVCDGIDNDCTVGEQATETAGVPDALSLDVVVAGTVPLGEVDLDQDQFVTCDDFDPDGEQVVWVSGSCADAAVDGDDGDCNDLCSIELPDTEERCDGLTNVCDGAGEPGDDDDDGHRVCGLGSGDDGEKTVEDLYVVVWVAEGEGASGGGGAEDETGASETGAGETGASETGTGETGPGDSTVALGPLIVPLVLPRLGAPDCDAELDRQLTALVGAEVLDAAVADDDPTALLDACRDADGAWRCGLVRLSLGSDADEDLSDNPVWIKADQAGYVSEACFGHPEQYVSRTVWSAARVQQARRLVVEAECRRMYGAPCAELSLPAEPVEGWDDEVDLTLQLDRDVRWWVELGRFSPVSLSKGSLMMCWGDATERDDLTSTTGGDCADEAVGANRDEPEGPLDLVVHYRMAEGTLDAPPDCSVCMDGVDNNCDGQVDCADPSCAVCFVGVGGGCAGSDDNPCATASCASAPDDSPTRRLGAALVGLVLTGVAGLRRRR